MQFEGLKSDCQTMIISPRLILLCPEVLFKLCHSEIYFKVFLVI